MASMAQIHALLPPNSIKPSLTTSSNVRTTFLGSTISSRRTLQKSGERKPLTVVAAAGDVSSDGTIYLIAGAAAVALIGTAFPLVFSRKDTSENTSFFLFFFFFSLILEILIFFLIFSLRLQVPGMRRSRICEERRCGAEGKCGEERRGSDCVRHV